MWPRSIWTITVLFHIFKNQFSFLKWCISYEHDLVIDQVLFSICFVDCRSILEIISFFFHRKLIDRIRVRKFLDPNGLFYEIPHLFDRKLQILHVEVATHDRVVWCNSNQRDTTFTILPNLLFFPSTCFFEDSFDSR